MTTYKIIRSSSLSHHGILGQKWGKKNGPPYPLSEGKHSSREKKAKWKRSLGKSTKESSKKKFHLTDKQKKIAKIGAAAAIGLGVGIYLYKSGNGKLLIEKGKQYSSAIFGAGKGADSSNIPKIGKSFDDIDRDMVASINPGSSPGQYTNCFHCSTAYILNSMFGDNYEALPNYGVDEVSGMVRDGRSLKLFDSIFDGISKKDYTNQTISWKNALNDIKPGSTGVISINGPTGGKHVLCYEKTTDGSLTWIDGQSNKITNMDVFDLSILESRGYSPAAILDFSEASLKEDAEDILKYLVRRRQ